MVKNDWSRPIILISDWSDWYSCRHSRFRWRKSSTKIRRFSSIRNAERYILPLIILVLTMTTVSSLYVYTCALTLNFRSAIHWYLEAKSQCIINENIVSFFSLFFLSLLFLVATVYDYVPLYMHDDKVASFLKMLNILFMPFSARARALSSSLYDIKG